MGPSENPTIPIPQVGADWPGTLIVLSGPSGAGKTAVTERVIATGLVRRAITATTRAPRAGERDGEDYYFYPDAEAFRADERAGRFLETAVVHGECYGTPWPPVAERLQAGETVILVIDVQGAQTLMRRKTRAAYIFIEPPSLEVLERRLRDRSTDDAEAIALRLEDAQEELAHRERYDYRIINDDLDKAVNELERIVREVAARSPERK